MNKPPLFIARDLPPILPSCVHYAGNEHFISKAIELQRRASEKFDIACDLEDGAPIGREREFLRSVIDVIASTGPESGRIGVRVHALEERVTVGEISALLKKVGKKLAFITIPKITSSSEAKKAARLVARLSREAKLKAPVPLHLLIETRSILDDLPEIAANRGVQSLDFGLLDFIADHGTAIPEDCMHSPGQFEHRLIARAKTELVAAALRHGKVPTHNICITLNDPEKIYLDALRARNEFGFQRMWSIHPAQIEPIQRALRPDLSKLQESREILALAEAAAWAPIRYQDRLYDRASFRRCYEVVRRAELYQRNT